MKEKFENYRQKYIIYVLQLRDVRTVGLLLFLVVVMLISWSGVKVIETNYGLQRQISVLEQQNQVNRLANDNLKLENAYYNTPTYLDIAARQNFGLAAPGETVWVVPKKVALARTVDLPNAAAAEAKQIEAKQPAYQRNFQAWMDFLLHRQRNEN
jgi:cell division protein FtsB